MPKRVLMGVVVSDKQDKTVVVRVERRFTHPLFKKTVRQSKKYHAHDAENACRIGDQVTIEEHAPISRTKRWIVIEGGEAGRPSKAQRVEVKKPEYPTSAPKEPKPELVPQPEAPQAEAPKPEAAKPEKEAKPEKSAKPTKAEKPEKKAKSEKAEKKEKAPKKEKTVKKKGK
jgi:small subunit ribosomal protein S17